MHNIIFHSSSNGIFEQSGLLCSVKNWSKRQKRELILQIQLGVKRNLYLARMLFFNSTAIFSAVLELCLLRFEISAHPHTTIFVSNNTSSAQQHLPKMFRAVMVVGENGGGGPLSPNENSSMLALVASARELALILDRNLARHLFIIKVSNSWDEKSVLAASAFLGCVQILEMHSTYCPLPKCNDLLQERKQIRILGVHWPPYLEAGNFSRGSLVPLENVSGFYVEYHKMMGELMGVKIIYEIVPDRICSHDDLVLDKLMDASLGLIYMPMNVAANLRLRFYKGLFTLTNSFHIHRLAWAVPSAKPSPAFLNLVQPLSRWSWFSVLATLAAVWLVGRLLARTTASRAFLDAVATLLGTSNSALRSVPRPAVLGLRLGCLVLTAAYQTKLASILTVPLFSTDLATPSDVIASETTLLYKMCLNHGWSSEFALVDEENAMHASVQRRTRLVSKPILAVEAVALGGAAFFGPQVAMQSVVYNSQYLRHRVRIQTEAVAMSPTGFYARREDRHLVAEVNRVTSRIKPTGLFGKWERDLTPPLLRNPRPATIPATLAHLTGAYLLLAVGLTAAMLAFLFELFKKPSNFNTFYGSKRFLSNFLE